MAFACVANAAFIASIACPGVRPVPAALAQSRHVLSHVSAAKITIPISTPSKAITKSRNTIADNSIKVNPLMWTLSTLFVFDRFLYDLIAFTKFDS